MRRIKNIIIFIVIILVVLSLTKNMIAKLVLSNGVKTLTGLRLYIGEISLGILETKIDIKDLVILNPSGYADKVMADIPQIYIDYDLGALFKGQIHFEHLKLDLKELIVVKNKEGGLNLHSLKVVKPKKEEAPAVEKKEKPKESKFLIDVLELKIGKVIYKDYSHRGKPVIKEYNINIDERYENIDAPAKLAKLILVRALIHTTIAKLAHLDLSPLGEGLTMSIKKITETTTGTATKVIDTGIGTGEKVIKGATDQIKKLFPIIKE